MPINDGNTDIIVFSGSVIMASGSVVVSNFPTIQSISGSVTTVSSGSVIVTTSGSVNVGNFPATQPISGSVSVLSGSILQLVSGSMTISQNVVESASNSWSGSVIAASGSFVGLGQSTFGVAGIQVSLFTDQNCTIYIQQSPDNLRWDISDEYTYRTCVGNFGITVQAVSSYFRTIVKNISNTATSVFRLQSVLCPIVEALPRSLTDHGDLRVSVQELQDDYGFFVENTPSGEQRAISPVRLVGSSFSGSVLDVVYWTAGSGSGSVVPQGSQVVLSTGSQINAGISLQSFRSARYLGGAANRARVVMRIPDSGSANNLRRWGAFTTTDGCFFELNGTTPRIVTRKTGVDTPVISGSFNGHLGKTIVLPIDESVQAYEIYWNNSKVWFTIGEELLHIVSASATTWTDTLTLPLRFENLNSGSSTSVIQMNIRSATIYRLGNYMSQPTSFYFPSGQTAGSSLKLGAGNLHSIIVNSVANTAVITLADTLSGTTPVIMSMVASNATTTPYTIPCSGLPFFNGLRLIVDSANASVTVIYE